MSGSENVNYRTQLKSFPYIFWAKEKKINHILKKMVTRGKKTWNLISSGADLPLQDSHLCLDLREEPEKGK